MKVMMEEIRPEWGTYTWTELERKLGALMRKPNATSRIIYMKKLI